MWTSKPGISRVHTAKSSFPTRSRLMLVVTEEVKRPSLFSEDVENVSPSRATKLKKTWRRRTEKETRTSGDVGTLSHMIIVT